MIIALKAVHGKLYLRALKKKIQVARELFIIEIEQGEEVYIPGDLSQDQLPYSFRYYDPVMMFAQDAVSDYKRDYFNVKGQIAFYIHRQGDLKQRVLEKLGFVDNGKEKKLTYKHDAANKVAKEQVDHHVSEHTLALQRSKYICIDDNLDKENILGKNSKKFLNTGMKKGEFTKDELKQMVLPKNYVDNAGALTLRYCPVWEVNKKRQKLIISKS